MSELSCNVVVEYEHTHEIKSVVDFPLRIHGIGMVQYLAQALRSKELDSLVTREGSNLSTKAFTCAVLNKGRINGQPVATPIYRAVANIQDFIAANSDCKVRIYAHWANQPNFYE